MPHVSVVIPCYNASATLDRTLASLMAQTFTDWEAICVDDGSSDNTLARLYEVARADARFRVVQQENAGPSVARNRGVELASGRIVSFLDADDLWRPGKLASVVGAFSQFPDAGAVYGQIAFFRNEDEDDATTSTVTPGVLALDTCLGENPVCTLSNLSVERAAFLLSGGFDPSMVHGEDLEWLVRGVLAGLPVIGVDEPHVRYRASEEGLSANLMAMHSGWRRAVSGARVALGAKALQQAEAVHLRYLARRALRMGKPAHVALGLAARGLALGPRAFLGGRHRGPATLLGCLAAPFLPTALRRRAFA
ncbi:MAG: glycosyltransferase [Pseudomonadota bacterium]